MADQTVRMQAEQNVQAANTNKEFVQLQRDLQTERNELQPTTQQHLKTTDEHFIVKGGQNWLGPNRFGSWPSLSRQSRRFFYALI